jgi:hypothetical protein
VSTNERWPKYHQCSRKRGFGPDGLYCKQHDPAAEKERRQTSAERWGKEQRKRMAPYRRVDIARRALLAIAEGVNDARAAAAEALKQMEEV